MSIIDSFSNAEAILHALVRIGDQLEGLNRRIDHIFPPLPPEGAAVEAPGVTWADEDVPGNA